MPTYSPLDFAVIEPLPRRNGKAALKLIVGDKSVTVNAATLIKLATMARDSQDSSYSIRIAALPEEELAPAPPAAPEPPPASEPPADQPAA